MRKRRIAGDVKCTRGAEIVRYVCDVWEKTWWRHVSRDALPIGLVDENSSTYIEIITMRVRV